MSKPKIEDKPKYCHAWKSQALGTVLCNTIPCCGFCVSPAAEKAIKQEKGFGTYNKVGRNPLSE